MPISENDTFTIEWVFVKETEMNWAAVINVECYGALLKPDTGHVLVALGDLKSRAGIRLQSGEAYLPLESWHQVVITGLQAMQNFVIHILTGSVGLNPDDALELAIGLTESLEEGCEIRPVDPRRN